MPLVAVADSPHSDRRSYWRCTACATVLLWPRPLLEENAEFEGEEAAEELAAAEDERLPLLRKRVQLAGTVPKGGGRLLDVGCSAGRVMGLAANSGWETSGIEMSAALAKLAAAHVPSAEVHTGDILQMDVAPLGTFDAILALDVIEHVLDPREFLLRMNRLLNTNGRLVLHTPNAASLRARLHGGRWNMLIPQYHFTLFTPGALRKLLQETGFVDVSVSTASGSGLERGLKATLAQIKEAALKPLMLGNALLVTARKP